MHFEVNLRKMDQENLEKLYSKLQRTKSGTFFVTLRKEFVIANDWDENDLLEVFVRKKE